MSGPGIAMTTGKLNKFWKTGMTLREKSNQEIADMLCLIELKDPSPFSKEHAVINAACMRLEKPTLKERIKGIFIGEI